MKNYWLAAGLLLMAACSRTPQQLEAEHMGKAKAYLAKKEYRKAVIEFKIASQNMPRDPEPLYQLAALYDEAKAGALAIETLHRALGVDPTHEASQLRLATIQVSSGHDDTVEEARRTLEGYLGKHPKDANALGSLALAEAKLNRPDQALGYLETVLAINPADLRPASLLVARYAAKGDVESAKAVSRLVEQRLPNSAEAAVLAAQVAAASSDRSGVEAQLKRALSLKADFGPALEMQFRKKILDRDAAGAEEVARALSRLPDRKYWTLYGRVLFSERKLDQGMAEYARVLAEHKGDAGVSNEYSALLQGSGRRKEAAAQVAATLRADPNDADALLQRASLAIENGDLTAASNDIEMLRQRRIVSSAVSYQESRIFAAQNNVIRQGDALAEALRLNPQMLPARLTLSRLLVASGKAKNALVVLDEASAVEKNTLEFGFHRTAALMADGEWAEARKGVDSALAVSRQAGILYHDAVLRLHEKDIAGARKSLEEALVLSPVDPPILLLLGQVLGQQGETARFLELLSETTAKAPQSIPLQMMLGGERQKQGDRQGARTAFLAARSAGGVAEADPAIAMLDMEAGAIDPARRRLLDLVKTRETVLVRTLLAELEARPGAPSPEAAVPHYLQILNLDPANGMALNNLAALMERLGKLEEAASWGKKALAAAPSNPMVADTIGWIYYRMGKYEAALSHLQNSLRLLDRPLAHYHLAAALAKTGNTQQGREQFDIALRQDPNSPARAVVAPLFESPRR